MMTYKTISTVKIEIPAKTSTWGKLSLTGEGNLLSLGLQNFGFKKDVYPTQLFIYGPKTGFFQVDNRLPDPVTVIIHGIVDGEGEFSPITDEGSKSITD